MAIMATRRRFTVQEYYRMARAGVLRPDERVELLDGQVVRMTPIGARHTVRAMRYLELFRRSLGERVTLWCQGPLRIDRFTELQPDVALLRPPLERYERRVPRPTDVFGLIEIADGSVAYDRRKATRYGGAGIRELWIVNLAGGAVEIHRRPHPAGYQEVRILGPGQDLAPEAFPDLTLRTDDLL